MKKVFLITGASKRLGKAISEFLLEKGHIVYATSRTPPENSENNQNLIWNKLDITNFDDCQRVIDDCIQKFGRIDVLINNASAYTGGKTILDLDKLKIDTEVDTTYKGAVYLSCLFVNKAKHQDFGKIFFISSRSGLLGVSGISNSVYAASKAALIRFSECLNEDIMKYGMQSHVIVPCNIREKNLIEKNAVSNNDVASLILNMTEIGDNLSISKVVLQPAKINLKK